MDGLLRPLRRRVVGGLGRLFQLVGGLQPKHQQYRVIGREEDGDRIYVRLECHPKLPG